MRCSCVRLKQSQLLQGIEDIAVTPTREREAREREGASKASAETAKSTRTIGMADVRGSCLGYMAHDCIFFA